MIRKRVQALASIAAWLPCSLHGAPDPGALIARLAREPPAAVAFTEARFSSLLREPIVTSGELAYVGARNLERRVVTPYRETTTIRGGSVRIEREGESPRTFALTRAPELEGFLNAFVALLAGDAAALARHFDTAVSGEEDAWQITLTPTDARARRRLKAIVINGERGEIRCLATLDAEGGGSVALIGAAEASMGPPSFEGLLAHCRAE